MCRAPAKPSVLLVDDDGALLEQLQERLRKVLPDAAELDAWQPSASDEAAATAFRARVSERTVVVITDYDLTGGGMRGLFGSTIVEWCQQEAIPVGEFSRKTVELPSHPSLFELRVPSDEAAAADFISNVYQGFLRIRRDVEGKLDVVVSGRSLAWVLATLLRRPELESEFVLYMARLGSGNAALVQRLMRTVGSGKREIARVTGYVVGHILLNGIIRFPGPLLTERALCAYVATSEREGESLREVFRSAIYEGPFDKGGCLFWREDVDKIVSELGPDGEVGDFASFGEYNRAMVESGLMRRLAAHDCGRCDGRNGGFLCPFTGRAVCQRGDCSVGGSTWIPQGAVLCRVEREFFDEWGPMLGM